MIGSTSAMRDSAASSRSASVSSPRATSSAWAVASRRERTARSEARSVVLISECIIRYWIVVNRRRIAGDVLNGDMGLRVLVVGATGKLGTKIVSELFARGAEQVRATHRAGT